MWFAVVVLAISVWGIVLGANSASAHDVLEATNPANGSTVATVPSALTMTMNNTPAAIGSQVQVLDAQGADMADGAVQVLDRTVTQAIKSGAPSGKYTVKWRLVSSDGHPIEGSFSFTATAASTGGAGANAAQTSGSQSSAQNSDRAVSDGSAPLSAAPSSAAAAPASSESGIPWLVVGFGAVAVIIVVILVLTARRKLAAKDE